MQAEVRLDVCCRNLDDVLTHMDAARELSLQQQAGVRLLEGQRKCLMIACLVGRFARIDSRFACYCILCESILASKKFFLTFQKMNSSGTGRESRGFQCESERSANLQNVGVRIA